MYQAQFKTLSPLTHGTENPKDKPSELPAGVKDNYSVILKLPVSYQGETEYFPAVSGNSLRGIFRRIGAEITLTELGLTVFDIPKNVYYLLFSGGALRDKIKIYIRNQLTIRAALPQASLFGAAYGKAIVEGHLIVHDMIPITPETNFITGLKTTAFFKPSMIGFRLMTCHPQDLPSDLDEDEGESPSIFHQEMVYPGVPFAHSFDFKPGINVVEKSLMGEIIRRFSANPRVGGGLSRGFGHLGVESPYTDLDSLGSFDIYRDYIQENKEIIIEYIRHLEDETLLKVKVKKATVDEDGDTEKKIKKPTKFADWKSLGSIDDALEALSKTYHFMS